MAPGAGSALDQALSRVGDRWSLLVVDALNDGPRRFADLAETVPGIATNVLSSRLRQLEADRVVIAVPYSIKPRRFAYELTDAGRALAGVVSLLSQWGSDYAGGGASPAPAHEACGTAMVAKWWCPTCEVVVDRESAGEPVWL